MGFTLKILEGPESGKSFSFDRIEITIGRTMENDVVLPDPGISRQHVSIRDKGGAYILKDLGSSNGTILNGRRIDEEEVIKSGDIIVVGGAQVRFEGVSGDNGGQRSGRTAASRPRAQRGVRARPARQRQARQGGARRGQGQAARRSQRPRRTGRRQATGQRQPDRSAKSTGPIIRSKGIRQAEAQEQQVPEEQRPSTDTARSDRRAGAPAPGGQPAGGGIKAYVDKCKVWFKGLNKRIQIALIAVVGILFVLLVVKAFHAGKEIVQRNIDHSDEKFYPGEYDANGEPMSYGLGPVSIRCRDKATFRFKYANGRATMTYSVAGIDNKQEVEIQLNKILVDYAPITLDKWSDYLRITLPRKHLLENEENHVTFLNATNFNDPTARETWAVEVASIEETPLPSPDRDAAREAFQLAKERYKARAVSPPNLYRALQNFKKARDFLELLPEGSRPDIYHEANEMVDKLEKELDKRIRNLFFTAEKHNEFKRYDQARETYRQIMLFIPQREDPRHIKARRKYDEYE